MEMPCVCVYDFCVFQEILTLNESILKIGVPIHYFGMEWNVFCTINLVGLGTCQASRTSHFAIMCPYFWGRATLFFLPNVWESGFGGQHVLYEYQRCGQLSLHGGDLCTMCWAQMRYATDALVGVTLRHY